MRSARNGQLWSFGAGKVVLDREFRIKRVKLLARPKGLLRMGVGHLAFIIAQCDAQSRLWLGVKT